MLNHKDLLYNTGNYTQYLITTYNKKLKRTYICITESLCYILDQQALYINYISIKKHKHLGVYGDLGSKFLNSYISNDLSIADTGRHPELKPAVFYRKLYLPSQTFKIFEHQLENFTGKSILCS